MGLKMCFVFILILFLANQVSLCKSEMLKNSNSDQILIDDISTVNTLKWDKNELSWSLINGSKTLGYRQTYYILQKSFKEWEDISIFKFKFEGKSLTSDILIYFMPLEHHYDEKDRNFNSENTLAHAFYPPNSDIHFNNKVNWSLSYRDGTNLFNCALHEIGHALGLNHIMDAESIMYPFYIERSESYSLSNSVIDKVFINEKYKDLKTTYTLGSSTIGLSTQKPLNRRFNKVAQKDRDLISNNVYSGFTCLEVYDWCEDQDLIFSNIFNLDGNLYIYKKNIFWIISRDDSGLFVISKKKYNHEIYFHDVEVKDDLISMIRAGNSLIILFKDRITVKKLNNCELERNFNLQKIHNQLANFVFNGLYYNSTSDTLYLFSLSKPKSYTKVKKFLTEPEYEEKPIELFYLDTYNYEKVFEFDNKVFFMKNNRFDYYDFKTRLLVKDISFRDYFLRDECELLPMRKKV